MKLEDGIKFATTQLALFASTSYAVATSPLSGYNLERGIDEEGRKIYNEHFWAYTVICIFLGSTVISFIPEQYDSFVRGEKELLFTIITTLWLWFLFAIFAFFVTRLLKGTAGFVQTVKTSFIVLATAYTISALVALTAGIVLKIILKEEYMVEFSHFAYIISQALFLLVYLPANLGEINKFKTVKKIIVGVVLPVSVLITNLALMVLYIESFDIGFQK